MARLTPNTGTLRLALNWVPILMFHEVLPDDTAHLPPYAVTRSGLRAILSDFASRGYSAGTLDDVIHRHGFAENGGGTPTAKGKQVVITFDDGTRDFLDNALPVLQETGFTATLFIVAGMVGGKRTWHALPGQPNLAQVPLMDADELRTLHNRGFTIGSHSVAHPLLNTLSDKDAREELARSRSILTEMIGQPIKWFAYPYLAATETTKKLANESGYWGACGGPNQPHSQYYLNRVDGSGYTLPELRKRTSGLYHITRQLVRQARYRQR